LFPCAFSSRGQWVWGGGGTVEQKESKGGIYLLGEGAVRTQEREGAKKGKGRVESCDKCKKPTQSSD